MSAQDMKEHRDAPGACRRGERGAGSENGGEKVEGNLIHPEHPCVTAVLYAPNIN